MSGMSLEWMSKSSSESGTPIRPAIANKWITKLVEPPMAAFTLIAFQSLTCQDFVHGQFFLHHLHDSLSPTFAPSLSASYRGGEWQRFPVNVKPSDSTMLAMVLAVPITAQWPSLRHKPSSAAFNWSLVILPERYSSLNRHTSLVLMFLPRNFPVSIGHPIQQS